MDISIFDARSGLDREAGAGIQLNGALSVLGKINPSLQRAVLDAGQPIGSIRSRSKPWQKETEKLFESLLDLQLRDTIRNAGPEVAEALMLPNDELLWTSIMRGTLQETLYTLLPEDSRANVAFGKTLTGIQPDAIEGGAMCAFSDGSQAGPFDLVIGCDGIKSAVKEYVDKGRISKDPNQREGAAAGIYTGLRIRYAVQDGNPSVEQQNVPPVGTITQYFGDAAYCFSAQFGAGKGRPNARCAFITFLDEDYFGPFQRTKNLEKDNVEENADWTQDTRQSVGRTRELMLRQLRNSGAPDMELRPIIESADRFFELGVYAHNPFCRWSKEIPGSNGVFVALAGDSAHALPPFLGQGGNQAIQDAYCLATRIHDYNRQCDIGEESLGLKSFLDSYESTRWPATFAIFWKAAFLGYLETGGFEGAYAKFRDVFFKTMGVLGVARQVLLSAATPKV